MGTKTQVGGVLKKVFGRGFFRPIVKTHGPGGTVLETSKNLTCALKMDECTYVNIVVLYEGML